MGANKFVLKHENIEVDYTLSGSVGNLALNYRDAAVGTITFSAPEISTTSTALGTLVSVGLLRTVDTGGESFGVFLPDLDVPPGEREEFSTVGVYYRFRGLIRSHVGHPYGGVSSCAAPPRPCSDRNRPSGMRRVRRRLA